VAGRADLMRETQDLQVLIVPNVDIAGTAALAAMAINPAIGLGTLLAQWVLREPLKLASTREFRVTGPWADPQVQRIERAAGSPLPFIDAPAPAADGAPSDEKEKPG
jgi:uncharacterized protein YhdP